MDRRDWFVVHGWIGITAGLMLFVVCWSGTVAVLSQELDWLLNPALRRPAASVEPLDWIAVHRSVATAYPDGEIFQIAQPAGPSHAAEVLLIRSGDRLWRVYVDPGSGCILADTSYFNIQRFFRSFHMNLFFLSSAMDLGLWGYRIVEVLGIALLCSVASSLVFYRRWWRGLLALDLRHGARLLASDLHKLAGTWGLWFALIIGVTGVWYLAEEFVPRSPESPTLMPGSDMSKDTMREPDLARWTHTAEGAIPGFRITRIILPQQPDQPVEILGFDGAWLVRDRAAAVWIDPRDGTVAGIQRTSDLSPLQRWIDTADPLHFGNFGGLWSKIIWVLFGTALSGLTLTGAYLAAKRQRAAFAARRARLPIWAAYGATISLLLVATYGGWLEIRDYGMPIGGVPKFPDVPGAVVAFIAAWIASTIVPLTLWVWKLR